MSNKKVKFHIPAFDVNMGGVIIKQALPTMQVEQVDPFLLLHHAKFTFRDDAPALHQGIGPHPHRGFSPVTFVIEGEIHHRDSRGNNQIASEGEVQWMHAGAGIIHSERPSQKLVNKNGLLEIIQLWINSPASKKMQIPKYQYLSKSEMPVIYSEDTLVKNRLIAGNYSDQKGKIETESDLLILWSQADVNGHVVFDINEDFESMLYVVKGSLRIEGFGLMEEKSLLVFDMGNDQITIDAKSKCEFLLLAGKPIKEKLVQQGPFVMNSETEIMEAMRDYQMGKMGILIEER